jgi:hypothetical protein
MLTLDLHEDTRRIVEVLTACPVGEHVTLDQLSATIGRDIRLCRYYIYSAMRVVQRDHGFVFATEWRKGYRRLNANELDKIGQSARARIRSHARRGVKTIAAGLAGANDIDPAAHRRALSEQTALGLLEHISRDKNLPTIAETDTRPLPVAIAAREFMKRIGAV